MSHQMIEQLLLPIINDRQDKNGTTGTIRKIIKNILDNPTETKYRRLKVNRNN